MRDFLVSGTMPYILVMSVYFLVRFVMYVVPADSLGGTDVFAGENLYKRCFGYHTFRYVA